MKYLFFLLTLNLVTFISYCQIKATTNDGEAVVLYVDGTWKYEKALAYDCTNLLIRQEEKTGYYLKNEIGLGTISGTQGGIYLIPFKKEGADFFLISISVSSIIMSDICIAKDDYAVLIFQDGMEYQLQNESMQECDKYLTFGIGGKVGKSTVLNELINNKLRTIKVFTSNDLYEDDFENEVSERIMYTLRCLSK